MLTPLYKTCSTWTQPTPRKKTNPIKPKSSPPAKGEYPKGGRGFIGVNSCALVVQNGALWDKFGNVWDYLWSTKTTINRVISIKNAENMIFTLGTRPSRSLVFSNCGPLDRLGTGETPAFPVSPGGRRLVFGRRRGMLF